MSISQKAYLDQLNQPESKNQASQKAKKLIFKDASIKSANINSLADQIKTEDNKCMKDQKNEEKQSTIAKIQKSNLNNLKAQAIKELKNIEKEQIQAEVMLRKSKSRLPTIRNSHDPNKDSGSRQRDSKQNLDPRMSHKINRNQISSIQKNYSIENQKKVYMSRQDIQILKKLKDSYRKKQQEMIKKVQAQDLFIQKMKTQQILEKQKQREKQRSRRLKSIEEKLKNSSKQREERFQKYLEENKKLKQLKNEKKLFQKLQEQFQKNQQKQKYNLNEMIKSRVGQSNIDFDQIKQHEKQYVEKNKQKIENSRLRIKSKIKEMEEEFHNLNLHKSHFYDRVKNQKKEILKEIEKNQRNKKICSQKVKEYNYSVKQNFMPSIRQVQRLQEPKKPKFSTAQIRDMGNDYMRQSIKLIDRNKSAVKIKKIQQQEQERRQVKTYKNYLHEMKKENQPDMKSNFKTQKDVALFEKELKQIHSITNAKQKYQKIKALHNKIERDLRSSIQTSSRIKLKTVNTDGKPFKKEGQKDIERIRAKLKLLECI